MSKRSSLLTVRGLPPARARRRLLLVTFDVDAPVGAAARAEHADGAVLLFERDDAARPDRRRLLLVRVLNGRGALRDRLRELLERHAQALEEPSSLRCHQNATLKIAVTMMLSKRDGNEDLPRELLQLVLPEPGIGEAHPEEHEGDDHHLREEHERADDVHRVVVDADERHRPAAEEHRGREGGERAGSGELADEEEQEAEAAVLGEVAGDELGLGDGHVERRLCELGLGGDQEDDEGDELREDVRVAEAAPAEDRAFVLRDDDLLHVQRAGLDDHADDGEHHRELVGDQLTCGPQATHQRVLVRAGPARHQDAEHRERRHRQREEDAGRVVGEDSVGPERDDEVDEERADEHDDRRDAEDELVGAIGAEVLLLEELADLGEELHRAVRPGFHRAEAALHEADRLEQVEVDDRARGDEHRDEHAEDAQKRLAPVGDVGSEDPTLQQRVHQRSMSPRMKYRLARIVMTSGTYTPFSSHGVIEMLLNDAERIFTRNGPRSPLLTT